MTRQHPLNIHVSVNNNGCFMWLKLLACWLAIGTLPCRAQTREEKVRADKARVEAEGFWMYNDLDGAIAAAEESGKPIVVVLRCIPCEECVKLDDDVMDADPTIRPLLEQFIRVRIVGTNGLELNLFQFDTDQSFTMFMMNADKTIYGRFGTRSHRTDWVGDVSLEGLAKALEGALDLHKAYPNNRSSLAGKQGKSIEFASPELYPALRDKYTDSLNYSGDVVKSCIHCHQIGDARREFYWQAGKPIPDTLLFPYPHPKSIGLVLDPKECATVKSVEPESPAAVAGVQAGDEITSMNGQPLLSMADVQWVLESTPPDGSRVELAIRRGDENLAQTISLPAGWREAGDTSWRVSSWEMCRIATGGMRLKPIAAEKRQELELPDDQMALEVTHVGQYGEHATAKKAGFQKGDIVIGFDGRRDLMRESDVFAHVNRNRKPGNRLKIDLLRGDSQRTLELPAQK